MQNENIQLNESTNTYPGPAFVVLPKEEDITINEVETEKIPQTAVTAMNQSEITMEEEPTSNVVSEEIEELELTPNGFSGMYLLVTILMITMIGISILGIILS